MKWLTDLLTSNTNALTPLFAKGIYILKQRELRTQVLAKITQQHREGIMLVIWGLPQNFEGRCKQSLLLLSETANLAQRFKESAYKDIKDTSKNVSALLQIDRLFDNPDMTPQTRRELTERQEDIKIDLIRKLHRL